MHIYCTECECVKLEAVRAVKLHWVTVRASLFERLVKMRI